MKSREKYESELKKLIKIGAEDSVIDRKVSNWQKTLPITVFVANNEQNPWDVEALGFTAKPMPTKAEAGVSQVGDYQYWIETPGKHHSECYGPLLVERKTLPDFYGTLYGDRDRFYREIGRFQNDHRFNRMVVVVESNINEWYRYKPFTSKYTVPIDSKQATLASLVARGVVPLFAGSRNQAVRMYGHLVRQSILKNWRRWI